MWHVIQSRITRLSKLTCIFALFILVVAFQLFTLFGQVVEYFVYMTNIFSPTVANAIVLTMKFGVAFIVLGYYVWCIVSGEWDLNYKLIIRKRLKEQDYESEFIEYIEEIKNICIMTSNGEKQVALKDIIDVTALEKAKSYFVKINNHVIVLRDLEIRDLDAKYIRIRKHKYIKHPLILNKGLYGYTYQATSDSCEELNDMPIQEADLYLLNAYSHRETNLKDSFSDDLKDSIRMLKVAGLSVVAIAVGVIAYRGYTTNAYKVRVEANGIITTSSINNIKVIFDDRESIELMPYVNNQLAQINRELLSKFNSAGWKIRITSDSMNDGIYFGLKDDGTITGATSFQYKYIIIPNTIECIDASVIHEMGHVLDNWKYTRTDEWRDIYNAEKDKYVREYARTNQFEGFACAYMEYVINRESFERRCPRTCEFIEKALSKIELDQETLRELND